MTTVAHREVLSLPVRYLAELPAPSALTLRVPALETAMGGPVPVLLTTSRERAQEAAQAAQRGEPVVCLTPLEFEPLAVALADGRLVPSQAVQELARKAQAARQGREHRLTREPLLGPVRAPSGGGEAWTFGELLEALGAELDDVEVCGG